MQFKEIIQTAPHIVQRKLEQLKFLRERPDYHPEPSVFHHIEIVTNRLIPTGNPDLIMSGVFHDICKFDTVRENPKTGFPTCPGHDDAAHDLILNDQSIQDFILQNGANVITVANLCKSHMRFHKLGEMRPAKRENEIQIWKFQGIFDLLHIFGAADNMLVEFDLNNLEQSWKFNK
jgi:hypothetical protein